MRSIVTKCAERAFARGYKHFGVQFYGECWGDDRPRPPYDKHGHGKGCTDGELYNHKYSQLSLRRTPSGPALTVRLREVSAL